MYTEIKVSARDNCDNACRSWECEDLGEEADAHLLLDVRALEGLAKVLERDHSLAHLIR